MLHQNSKFQVDVREKDCSSIKNRTMEKMLESMMMMMMMLMYIAGINAIIVTVIVEHYNKLLW